MNKLIKGFDPIVYDNPKYLILGSLPSVRSLERNEYYGHPQNRFWKVLSVIYDEDISTYENKKLLLKKHHIALWDTIGEAEREGSSDLKITNPIPNDIVELIAQYSTIEMILCTGTLSYTLCQKYFGCINIPIVKLPSPSPANAACSLDRLVAEYQKYLK